MDKLYQNMYEAKKKKNSIAEIPNLNTSDIWTDHERFRNVFFAILILHLAPGRSNVVYFDAATFAPNGHENFMLI